MIAQVSVFEKMTNSSTPIGEMSIRTVLFSDRHKQKIELLRLLPKGSKEFDEIKRSLPCYTPSGTFYERNKQGLKKHYGNICVEWDNVDDPEALKKKLSGYEFIWYAGLSCSGKGVFAFVEVAKPEKHSEYFHTLKAFFDKEGIPIDSSGSDFTRLRVASYDAKPYLNNQAAQWREILPPTPVKEYKSRVINGENIDQKLFLCGLDYIQRYGIDITVGRNNWLALGSMIKSLFGSLGEDYFVALSQYHLKFNDAECRKTFQKLHGGNYSIGVFCAACSREGVPNLNNMVAEYIRKEVRNG